MESTTESIVQAVNTQVQQVMEDVAALRQEELVNPPVNKDRQARWEVGRVLEECKRLDAGIRPGLSVEEFLDRKRKLTLLRKACENILVISRRLSPKRLKEAEAICETFKNEFAAPKQ
jgi:hypothetical protein